MRYWRIKNLIKFHYFP